MAQTHQRSIGKKKETVPSSMNVNAKQITNANPQGSSVLDVDYAKMTTFDILKAIIEKNKDPEIDKMAKVVLDRLPHEMKETVEAEKRGRSLVVSGLPEADEQLQPSAKQRYLEGKIREILDVLMVECNPVEVYRLGRPNDRFPRLVKVVLPSRSHWTTALSNSYRLRNSGFNNIYVRKSMTQEERRKDFELRQICRERNKNLKHRTWVVYRGKLMRVEDLPKIAGNVSQRKEHTQA